MYLDRSGKKAGLYRLFFSFRPFSRFGMLVFVDLLAMTRYKSEFTIKILVRPFHKRGHHTTKVDYEPVLFLMA